MPVWMCCVLLGMMATIIVNLFRIDDHIYRLLTIEKLREREKTDSLVKANNSYYNLSEDYKNSLERVYNIIKDQKEEIMQLKIRVTKLEKKLNEIYIEE